MNKNNVRIMGDGNITGGIYGNIRIMGDGVISGDIEADELHVSGDISSECNVKLGRLKLSGSGEFKAIQAEEMKVSGSVNFRGPAVIKEIDVMGEVKAFNGIKAEKIKVRGSIEDRKSIEAEMFDSYGGMEIKSLNADDINIKLYGENRAEEIVGSTINVIYPTFKKILLGMFFFRRNRALLEVETVEGDRIYLERTTAASVKGNEVNIGPGCKIKSVEYSGKIFIDKSSTVDNQIKI